MKNVNHTNCLWGTHPHIAKLLVNKEEGYKYSFGSHHTTDWRCIECGNIIKNKPFNKIVTRGLSCPKCSDGISYPEKFMYNVLEQLGIEFEYQKRFKWANNKKYDFYFPIHNLVLEVNGIQHYEESFETISSKVRTLKKEKENDYIKKELATENDVSYICIDARYSNIEWIRNNVLKSELNNLFNLNNIDWIKCHEHACNSIVKKVSEIWNDGMTSTLKISKHMKLGRTTVQIYLRKGVVLGWCNYNPKEEMSKVGKRYAGLNKKQIIQMSLQNEFIKRWESLTEASDKLNLSISALVNNLRGRTKHSGGYKWMYKEDYDEYIEQIYNNNLHILVD